MVAELISIMKIYFVVRNCFPNGLATTTRVVNYCKGFIENNINCEVIIPIAIERYETSHKNTEYRGVYEGIPFQYISKTPIRSKYLLYRQIKDIIDYLKTLIYLTIHVTDKDIILVYEGGNTWCYWLAQVSRFKKAHIIMELNELPYIGENNIRSVRKRNKMLNLIFPLFDGFITISEKLSELAIKHAPKSKIIKIPIIVDCFKPDNIKHIKRSRPYLFHSGTLTEQKDGIVGILEAFAIANKKLGNQLDYIFTGNPQNSPDYLSISETIKKYNLEQYVHFIGYVSNDELQQYQKNSLAMIINKYDTLQNKYCFSTKLGEYLSFSKPVIITDVGEAVHYLNNNNAYIVPPTPQAIANQIINIFNNKAEATSKGKEGYKVAYKIFNYKYQGKRLCNFFEELTSH